MVSSFAAESLLLTGRRGGGGDGRQEKDEPKALDAWYDSGSWPS